MATCLLVLLVVIPSFDVILCQNDTALAAAPSMAVSIAKSQAAPASAPHQGDVGDVCPHGHCHHFSAYAANDGVSPALTTFPQSHTSARDQGLPPSHPASTPDRPPRV